MKIGIDIVEIDKLSRLIDRWEDKFLTRLFSDRELKEWEARGRRLTLLAGKFATKEAFFKANRGGQGFSLASRKEIEVLGAPSEPPVIWVKGQKVDTQLSISHTQQVAVSIVVINV